ncbi:MAG: M23 family metallopeptidase [Alphaproteobacteria bacterium]|nr:M23 family metallopeptidase [Alphaproteobacteria bacterium]
MAGFGIKYRLWAVSGAALLAAPALALRLSPAPILLDAPYVETAPVPSAQPVQQNRPVRYSGKVIDGLYASLRAAGVGIQPAQESLRALGAHIDFATDVTADTQFDVVLAGAEQNDRSVVYISLSSPAHNVQLVPVGRAGAPRWADIAGPDTGGGGLVQPVPQAHTSSGFGLRWHPLLGYSRFHKGVDYAAASGTPIYAVADGVVTRAGWAGGYGQLVRLGHGGGVETAYAHMQRIAVRAGASVTQGQIIGYVGTTGLSTGPHLHFEVYRDGDAIDPSALTQIVRPGLSDAQRVAWRGRVAQLLAIAVTAPPLGG